MRSASPRLAVAVSVTVTGANPPSGVAASETLGTVFGGSCFSKAPMSRASPSPSLSTATTAPKAVDGGPTQPRAPTGTASRRGFPAPGTGAESW